MAKKVRKKQEKQIKRLLIVVVLFILLFFLALASINHFSEINFFQQSAVQDKDKDYFHSKQDFIQTLAPIAQDNQARYGVPASISLAQAILESDWGQSDLARQNKNLYGIKGSAFDPIYWTQEFLAGEMVDVEASFRSYSTFAESMADHSQLLLEGTDYNSSLYQGVVEAEDYVQAAQALQQAGYATDPDYAEKLISLIQQYDLARYDTN